jgi:hypothetical protein
MKDIGRRHRVDKIAHRFGASVKKKNKKDR